MGSNYEELSLEELREECRNRNIVFGDKDGTRNLCSKLRVNDKERAAEAEAGRSKETFVGSGISNLREQMQLLELQRQMRREEREAAREEREARMREKELELQLERERREFQRQQAQAEEERQVREELRLRELRREKEESELRVLERQERVRESLVGEEVPKKPVPFKMREMREKEDIDDYFKVFEMTAQAQSVPYRDWVGHLVPKLSEKAKSVYLEISGPDALHYEKAKEIIMESYQLTVEHYRYRFRTSDKLPDEDFVQWARRTRRYLDRWMAVAKATEDANLILEQITMERLLDAVSPELQAWLIERKPKSAVELATLANEHIQARKGPFVDGKYVNKFRRGSPQVQKRNSPEMTKTESLPTPKESNQNKRLKSRIQCYKCKDYGHISINCPSSVKTKKEEKGCLCMKPLSSQDPFSGCSVKGFISGRPAQMLVDTGCSRTLVHRKYVREGDETDEKITVLTVTGERIIVPLAWVAIKTERGVCRELVGVVESLPTDCLLGRSSYGKTITKQHLLDQWEANTEDEEHAFVMTRRQRALQKAQERSEKMVDRENSLAIKTLSHKPVKKEEVWDEVSLRRLFGEPVQNEKDEKRPVGRGEMGKNDEKREVEERETNILDRNRSQVIEDQETDVTLEKIRPIASDRPQEDKDGYFYRGKLLMHRKMCKSEHNGVPYLDRIVVPESCRQEILRVGHTIPLAGHMGREKTYARISNHFYWPQLSSDVNKFCATCPECQMVARKRVAQRAPLKPVPIVTEPFRKIAIDIVGELPRTKTGYKYILVVVDYATRYPDAFPMKTTHSKVIAEALISCFCRVGIPEEIVSDQGANLIGKLMSQLFEQLGVSHIKTSVYHPEANGLVERFNGTLKHMLRKFAGECTEYWDKYLPYLLFAYREVPCPSTGYSPFELLYGRIIRGPLAVVKETWLEEKSPDVTLVTHVLEMRKRMAKMREVTRENLQTSQAKQKKHYDVKSSNRKFEEGDKVLVLLPTPGSKLQSKWNGPFTVTKVKDGGRSYELDTGKTVKQHRTFNINLLSKWHSKDEDRAFVVEESREMSLPHENSLPQLHSTEIWQDVDVSNDLNEQQRREVHSLLEQYSDVFSGNTNRTTAATHQIDTGDAKPIRSAPYKIPQRLEEAVQNEIENMLEMDIIRPSTSPWSSPIVIVPKPDGSIRFCVDYRKLNQITKMDAYPLPRIDRMIEKVGAAKYITTLDMTKGYWQIPLEESAIEKSAFVTSKGLFEFLVMPFGMKTAPATFQRMMKETILKGLEEFTDAYIDDVEIDTTTTFTQHLADIRSVLERLRYFKLNARPSKCKVAMKTVDFVGHRVGNGSIEPKEALVKAVTEFPRPETKKQVRSFLGLVGYYRKFIPNFSEKAVALTDLTKGKNPTKVIWSLECEQAFNRLKKDLARTPVLKPPDWNLEFVVQTDASNRGLGAVLSQKDENGEEHPVVFASRKLQPREERLSTTEKECLAVVWAVELFRYYLFGRRFSLETDHNPLIWLNRVRDKSRKLLRWSLTLQEYDMIVKHKSGKEHANADALSRM